MRQNTGVHSGARQARQRREGAGAAAAEATTTPARSQERAACTLSPRRKQSTMRRRGAHLVHFVVRHVVLSHLLVIAFFHEPTKACPTAIFHPGRSPRCNRLSESVRHSRTGQDKQAGCGQDNQAWLAVILHIPLPGRTIGRGGSAPLGLIDLSSCNGTAPLRAVECHEGKQEGRLDQRRV